MQPDDCVTVKYIKLLNLQEVHLNIKELDCEQLLSELKANDVAHVRNKYSLQCPNQWEKVAKKLFSLHINSCNSLEGTQLKIADLNLRLNEYALTLPSFVTRPEFYKIRELLNKGEIDELKTTIASIVMDPFVRAWHHNDKFCKLDIFEEFHEFIHSSLICYYQKNYKSAYITLLPIIEGLILRWQEKGATGLKKPNFDKLKKFIGKSVCREPRLLDPHFTEIYINSVSKIINEHLYLDSSNTNTPYDFFNRHLALHMLEKRDFGTKYNVSRLFLLLDFLAIIYTNENRIIDKAYLFRPHNTDDANMDLICWQNLYKEAKEYQYKYIL
jgi:hypothetical protein